MSEEKDFYVEWGPSDVCIMVDGVKTNMCDHMNMLEEEKRKIKAQKIIKKMLEEHG